MDEDKTEAAPAPEPSREGATPPDEPKPTSHIDTVHRIGTISVADENGEVLFRMRLYDCILGRLTCRVTADEHQTLWNLHIPLSEDKAAADEPTQRDDGGEPGAIDEPTEAIAEQVN